MSGRFWLYRSLTGLFSIWLIVSVVFVVLRLIPGDAIQTQFIQAGLSPVQIEARRAAIGLDMSIAQQYLRFWWDTFQGDLGYSLYSGQAVSEIIAQRLPVTLNLALQAVTVSILLGFCFGCIEALGKGWPRRMASLMIGLGFSVPIYWTATLAVFGFVFVREPLFRDLMPGFILGFHSSSAVAALVSTQIHEARQSTYYVTAQAKGLTKSRILVHHVLRPGIPPVLSIISIQSGILLGGAVITESIFLKPGLGITLLNAVIEQDYPVVQALSALSVLLITLVSLVSDICWRLLDPRQGHEEGYG